MMHLLHKKVTSFKPVLPKYAMNSHVPNLVDSARNDLINSWILLCVTAEPEVETSFSLFKFRHRRVTQHFFFLPGPPYLGLSRHIEQD